MPISKIKILNQRRNKKTFKTVTSILESVDTVVVISSTTMSVTLSVTIFVFIVVPISAAKACASSLGIKALHKIILNNYNKYRNQYEEDQQTIKSLLNYI